MIGHVLIKAAKLIITTFFRFLKSFIETMKKKRKEIAKELAKKTDSELIDLTGFVIVLYKQ